MEFGRWVTDFQHPIQGKGGYLRQWADERLGDPPSKVDPGAFSGQRQGWKTPKRTLWQCTASVYVAGVHCWEISSG